MTFVKTTFHRTPFGNGSIGKTSMEPIDPVSGLNQPFWQQRDLEKLSEDGTFLEKGSANWSEMGCYKTSTGLWMAQKRCQGVEHPSVLVVTTRSGKGTYFQLAQKILPEWAIFNIGSNGIFVTMEDGSERRLKLDHLPVDIEMPTLVVTHYHTFSKVNENRFYVDKQGGLITDPDTGVPIPYELTQADYLLRRKWDVVILDEAHRIKEKDVRWTVNLKKVKARHRHVMTGTGFINRPHEIWSLLNFLDRTKFGSFNRFKEYFCDIEEDDFTGYQVIRGVKPEHKEEFRTLVRAVGVRRTLTEVMPNIKEPIFVRHDIELNPTQRRMYDQIKAELRMLDENGATISTPNVLSLLNRLRQITVATPELVMDAYDAKLDRRVQHVKLREPSSKLDTVMEIIEGLQWDEDKKEPLVVFSNFVDPLTLLKARLDKHNEAVMKMGLHEEMLYKYIWMKEEDNDQTRYQKWAEEFPTMGYRVFMSTLQLGGESINLTPARHVLFLDRSWSPKDNSQGIGRIRRPGQEGQPVVINIEAKNTTDQRIEQVNMLKQGWFKEIFGDEK